MRDIKFRGKRIDNSNKIPREFVYGSYVYLNTTGYDWNGDRKERKEEVHFIVDEENSSKVIDKDTIGQYTGLKDKNGVEIYEGDIVKIDVDTAFVKYSNDYSGFILNPIGDYYFDRPMLAHNIDIIDKVIGNIFDNKDLLE